MQRSARKEDIVELPMERLMLGDHVMGRIVVGLSLLGSDRDVVWARFDDWTSVKGRVDDPVPVDRAWR